MKIEHAALYVRDLERSKAFFEKYFEAKAGVAYHNSTTDFQFYFLSFEGGVRLEIMTRPQLQNLEEEQYYYGFAHIAFSLGSAEKVDQLARRFEADGYRLVSGPRVTGDGYYEAYILDFEGNQIELTV